MGRKRTRKEGKQRKKKSALRKERKKKKEYRQRLNSLSNVYISQSVFIQEERKELSQYGGCKEKLRYTGEEKNGVKEVIVCRVNLRTF